MSIELLWYAGSSWRGKTVVRGLHSGSLLLRMQNKDDLTHSAKGPAITCARRCSISFYHNFKETPSYSECAYMSFLLLHLGSKPRSLLWPPEHRLMCFSPHPTPNTHGSHPSLCLPFLALTTWLLFTHYHPGSSPFPMYEILSSSNIYFFTPWHPLRDTKM